MRLFYLPPEQCRSQTLTLTGAEAHHAAAVLRVRLDDQLAILDGAGRQLTGRVTAIEKKSIHLQVEETSVFPSPSTRITLLQAIPKGKIFESIIEKATELGAWSIIPLLSERVSVKLDGESAAHKTVKWQQTAVEAIKQSGQLWLPKVEEPQSVHAALSHSFDLTLVGSLRSDACHPREFFQGLSKPPARIGVWIGPEGDFTPAELDAIIHSGAHPINLGPLILRSETAATYALSIISYELQWANQPRFSSPRSNQLLE